ncbi:MAG: ATP-binding protein [Actinophytocola sp.]|uniref:ATP-binding protein n=1 Tax=Actinophytocola sp. TaxID=1872138 RepID=UPI003D6AD0EB
MLLVEREAQLAELDAAVREAGAGRGSLVLMSGEAGAGKTSLVTRFASDHEGRTGRPVLYGLCDALLTPRPFGPFRDMFRSLGGLPGGDDLGGLAGALDVLVDELDRPPHPAVAVVEDAHWADDATLDAIRFLGRRVARMRTVLIVTYRDDEVSPGHALRRALGSVPVDQVRRVRLDPLSVAGVARLADRRDVADLHRITGGNPFFVREVLAAPGTAVPLTVQDAVLARVGRLSAVGRKCVELVSVVPGLAERWLIEGCASLTGVDEAVRLGVLRADDSTVSFAHELARRAVEHGIASARRRELNRLVLEVLTQHQVDVARLNHHAVRADDRDAVVRFAPIAARRAASLDAHREAVDHFEQALRHADRFTAERLAGLWDDYARECYLAGRHERAAAALERAIEVHDARDDHERLGASLTLLADVQWYLGRRPEAEQCVVRAIAALERHPGGALAQAYALRAKLDMIDDRLGSARTWGEKAIGMARAAGDTAVLAHALNTVGCVRWVVPPYDTDLLIESLRVARAAGLTQETARAYHNLADGCINLMRDEDAETYLSKGIGFCDAHDLVLSEAYLLVLRALLRLDQGRWDEATADLRRPSESEGLLLAVALVARGTIELRRGVAHAAATLDQAHGHLERQPSAQVALKLVVARAELAWLGDHPVPVTVTDRVAELIDTGPVPWVSRAAFWLHRIGVLDRLRDDLLEPYRVQAAGRWSEAAALWSTIGRPYEQALALSDAPEPEPLLQALGILDRLGATSVASRVRGRLTRMGVPSVPRGPRSTTRTNPAGLTARQSEILHLLAEGLPYREIAERLHVATKTVDHHVAAVRAKLGVTTRHDAVEAARQLGILSPSAGTHLPK